MRSINVDTLLKQFEETDLNVLMSIKSSVEEIFERRKKLEIEQYENRLAVLRGDVPAPPPPAPAPIKKRNRKPKPEGIEQDDQEA